MQFTPFPILLTKRLRLQKIRHEDKEIIFFLRTDPEVNKYIQRPPTTSLEEATQFIEMIIQNIDKGESINWAITLHGRDEMIGNICLWNFSADRRKAEVGYDLLPDFQRQGIMTEALQAVLEYGFDSLKLTEIEAYTHIQNEASMQLLLKNGFSLNEEEKDEENPYTVVFNIQRTESSGSPKGKSAPTQP